MGRYPTDCTGLDLPAAWRRQDAPNLERLAERAAELIRDCDCDLILGCDGDPMLVVTPRAAAADEPSWLVTSLAPTRLRLEAVAEDVRLDLLAEAGPDRILARLSALAEQARQCRRATARA